MDKKFQEYKGLDLSQVNKDVLKEWESNNTFEQSLKNREGHPSFVFFEGPPSANGMPGIHHVMARTIKDIICRYKTLQGFLVERKAGYPLNWVLKRNSASQKKTSGRPFPWPTTTKNAVPTS